MGCPRERRTESGDPYMADYMRNEDPEYKRRGLGETEERSVEM